MVLRIFFACLLGGLLGWERERHGIYSAGIRTYSAISLGACAFGVIALTTQDPSHVAANIITGIGFLGGGIIFRQEGNYVAGVTTAATLWATAAIGLSVAFGMYLIAVSSTILIYLLLYLPRLKWWHVVSHPRLHHHAHKPATSAEKADGNCERRADPRP
jgi:putative Mg2+ transporter-C (MgtC) family protein